MAKNDGGFLGLFWRLQKQMRRFNRQQTKARQGFARIVTVLFFEPRESWSLQEFLRQTFSNFLSRHKKTTQKPMLARLPLVEAHLLWR
ncbi:MAG: hypothetical protein ACK5P7_11805 [Bdellovibrio sp.]